MSIDYEGLLSSFVSEATEMLHKAETAILKLEEGFEKELVNDIFRTFHTIKGDSGVFGLQRITDLSHSLENVLHLMRDEKIAITMDRVDLLLSGVDLLRQMISNIQDIDSIRTEELESRLKEVIAGESDGEAEEPSPIMRQGVLPSDPAKFSLRIPKKYIEFAGREGAYLALIYLDLYTQQINSLLAIRTLLERLEDSGELLMQGVFVTRRPLPGNEEQDLLPYYLLVKTACKPDAYLTRHGIVGKVLKILVAPEQEEVESVEPVPLQGVDAIPEEIVPLPGAVTAPTSSPIGFFEETIPLPESSVAPASRSAVSSTDVEETAQAAPVASRDISADTFLKVNVELLNELINLAGEAIIARNDLMQKVEHARDPGLVVAGKKMSYLVTRLQESIMRTRLQEIDTIFQRLPRLVRDLSRITGKRVELVTRGGEVELDKTLIDAIIDPVMHMVRNSIDHGLEDSEERLRLGKSEAGRLTLAASLRGGKVLLSIQDDGRGLDLERIREKALKKGLVGERELEAMPEEAVCELIFEPGFSTAENITQTSGRGVGMDVVRTNLKRVGGSVGVVSEAGRGTALTATLPQTLSIITCLMIKVMDRLYALPRQNIEELILIEPAQITLVEDHEMYTLRGHLLPLVRVSSVLYPEEVGATEPKYIAVVRTDRHRFGMMIEDILNPEEIVVKPLGEHFSELTLFSGAAIMGDGEAVLIFDLSGLARFTNIQSNLREELESGRTHSRAVVEEESGYLVIGVAENQFALPLNSVPRIEKLKTDQIETFMEKETIIFNDEIVPLVRLERVFDLGEDIAQDGNVLIFSINGMRIGVLATKIFNVVDSIPNLETGAYLGESIQGQAILRGVKTVVLDIIDLLSRLQAGRFREIHNYIEASGAVSGEASLKAPEEEGVG